MEEDIDIIIQDFKDLICLFRHTDNITINKRSAVLFRKTLNLLTRYKEMEYEIAHEYRTACKERDKYWKSKVKEKIEELEKDLERDRICIDFVIEHTKDIELMAKIKILQELL